MNLIKKLASPLLILVTLILFFTSMIVISNTNFMESNGGDEDSTTVESKSVEDVYNDFYNSINESINESVEKQESLKKDYINKIYEDRVSKVNINAKTYQSGTISIEGSSFNISDELRNTINNTINSFSASTAFYIVNLDDGFSIGYNVDRVYQTASSIKVAFALYVYKEISKGNIDPKMEVEYKQKHYNAGTGIIKSQSFGTKYTVEDLVYYALTESDNVAHTMLVDTFGVDGYNAMLSSLGTSQLYLTKGHPWGVTSCRSHALVWQEIYNYALTDDYGSKFMDILMNAKYNYFKQVNPDQSSACKTGFANYDVLATGIIFEEHPYAVVTIANTGGNKSAYSQVFTLIKNVNSVIDEYNTYKKS